MSDISPNTFFLSLYWFCDISLWKIPTSHYFPQKCNTVFLSSKYFYSLYICKFFIGTILNVCDFFFVIYYLLLICILCFESYNVFSVILSIKVLNFLSEWKNWFLNFWKISSFVLSYTCKYCMLFVNKTECSNFIHM